MTACSGKVHVHSYVHKSPVCTVQNLGLGNRICSQRNLATGKGDDSGQMDIVQFDKASNRQVQPGYSTDITDRYTILQPG